MAKRLELPKFQAFDANGDPLSGGKVYTWEAGTATLKTSYSDYDASTPNTNPVILDSRGEADIYVQGTYKIGVYTSADVLVWTLDNVQGGQGITDAMATYYLPEYDAADQGVVGDSDTINYAVDTISTDWGTIYLRHNSGSRKTTYTLTTSESIPLNIDFITEKGVIIDGAGTLTFDNAGQIGAQPKQKIFGSSITVVFTNGGTAYAEWWGENTTPGTTDMAAEIQAPLTAGADRLGLDATTYLTTSAEIEITGACEIFGYGESSTIIQTASTTAHIFKINTESAVTIRDMRLLNTKAGTPTAGAAIRITAASNDNESSRFLDLRIAFMYYGLEFEDATGWHIDRCEFVAMVQASIRIQNTDTVDSGNWTIANSNFNSDLDYTPVAHVLQESAGGGRISNCYFLRGQVGYYYFAPTGINTSMLEITGCSFELQDEDDGGTPGWGIKIDPQGTAIFQRFTITGCILDQNQGIFIDGTADANINQGAIVGNVFYGSGIDIDHGSDIIISGNSFKYLAGYTNAVTYDGDSPETVSCDSYVSETAFLSQYTIHVPNACTFITLQDSVTPSVAGLSLKRVGIFSNAVLRAITGFTNYVNGQEFKLMVYSGTAPTIANGDPFYMSAAWAPGAYDNITFLCVDDDFVQTGLGGPP